MKLPVFRWIELSTLYTVLLRCLSSLLGLTRMLPSIMHLLLDKIPLLKTKFI